MFHTRDVWPPIRRRRFTPRFNIAKTNQIRFIHKFWNSLQTFVTPYCPVSYNQSGILRNNLHWSCVMIATSTVVLLLPTCSMWYEQRVHYSRLLCHVRRWLLVPWTWCLIMEHETLFRHTQLRLLMTPVESIVFPSPKHPVETVTAAYHPGILATSIWVQLLWVLFIGQVWLCFWVTLLDFPLILTERCTS